MSRRRRHEVPSPVPEAEPLPPPRNICPVCIRGTMLSTLHTGDAELDGWLRCSIPTCGHMSLAGTRVCPECGDPRPPMAMQAECLRCRASAPRGGRPTLESMGRPRDQCKVCRCRGVDFIDGRCLRCHGKTSANPVG